MRAVCVSHPLVRGYVSACPDGAPTFLRNGSMLKYKYSPIFSANQRRDKGADGSARCVDGTGRLPISPLQRRLPRARGTAEP
eukprot:2100245-Prymnesium_polylepis.1